MACFNDFDSLQRQTIAVFDDNNTAGNSVTKKIFNGKGHPRTGLAATGDENVADSRKLVTPIGYLEMIIPEPDALLDRIQWICSFQPREKYFAGVSAQLRQRRHIADSNNRQWTISNREGSG
jgi:hypothetical protein